MIALVLPIFLSRLLLYGVYVHGTNIVPTLWRPLRFISKGVGSPGFHGQGANSQQGFASPGNAVHGSNLGGQAGGTGFTPVQQQVRSSRCVYRCRRKLPNEYAHGCPPYPRCLVCSRWRQKHVGVRRRVSARPKEDSVL